MERRGFLKSLIGGVAVAAAVQTFPFRVYSFADKIIVQPKVILATLGEYVTYTNFSLFAINSSIDSMIAEAAEELSKQHALRINKTCNFTYDFGIEA